MDNTFRDETLDNVERFYKEAHEAGQDDYDMEPTLLCLDDSDTIHVYVLCGDAPAPDIAKRALEHHIGKEGVPLEIAFVAPSWKRDPVTNERTGECVFVIFETHSSRTAIVYDVERGPLTLTRLNDLRQAHPRVELLYSPATAIH